MSSLTTALRGPKCVSCVRRLTVEFNGGFLAAGQQQVRGKKTLAKDKETTIKVRLLKDVTRYGKAGSIIPLAAGRMRNMFYPGRKAEYLTDAQLRELGDVAVERDYTFGLKIPESTKKPVETEKPTSAITVDLDLMKASQAVSTLEKILPKNLEFERRPIVVEAPKPQRRVSLSIPQNVVISDAAGGSRPAEVATDSKKAIHGSVSTADIVASIREVLAGDAEASRVVLAPEDISFTEETEEAGKVKHLGTFEIQIRPRGAAQPVKRTITVKAQE